MTNANNWTTNGVVDTAPSGSDDLTFGGGTVGTINLGGNRNVSSLHFTAGFTLGAPATSNTLNLNNGDIAVDPAIVATINAPLFGNDLAVVDGGILQVVSQISAQLTTVDGSTLMIDGTSTGNAGGFITDSTGTVTINAAKTISNNVTNNGTFNVNAATTISGSEIISNTGSFHDRHGPSSERRRLHTIGWNPDHQRLPKSRRRHLQRQRRHHRRRRHLELQQ